MNIFKVPVKYGDCVSRTGEIKCGDKSFNVKTIVNKKVVLTNGKVMDYESVLLSFSFIAGRTIEIGKVIRVIK